MEAKTKADSIDVTQCSQDDKLNIGMCGYLSSDIYSFLVLCPRLH